MLPGTETSPPAHPRVCSSRAEIEDQLENSQTPASASRWLRSRTTVASATARSRKSTRYEPTPEYAPTAGDSGSGAVPTAEHFWKGSHWASVEATLEDVSNTENSVASLQFFSDGDASSVVPSTTTPVVTSSSVQ